MMNSLESEDARRKPTGLFVWLVLAAGALLIWAIVTFRSDPADDGLLSGPKHPATGQKMSALDVQSLIGERTTRTLGDFAGKVVVVNFWAVWCGPCRRELPELWELKRAHAARDDFEILALTYGAQPDDDPNKLRPAAEQVLRNIGVNFEPHFDPGYVTKSAVFAQTGANGFPTTVVLDQRGVIRGVWNGYSPADQPVLAELVRELLAKGP